MTHLRSLAGVLALSVALSPLAATAHADDEPFFTGLVVFGDSLSDPGNIPNTLGLDIAFPGAPYVGNRFSNGPVYAEYLADILGLTSTQNFAHGGAFTGQLAIPGAPGTLGNISFVNTDLTDIALAGGDLTAFNQTDVLSQVGGYLAAGSVDPGALHTVFAGANDYFVLGGSIAAQVGAGTLNLTTAAGLASLQSQIGASVTNSVTNLSNAVGGLAGAGATQFVMPNLPNLGTTPQGLNSDEGLFTIITDTHNAALEGAAVDLAEGLGVTVYMVDVRSLTDDISANPAKYGLTNVTDSCIGFGGSICSTTVSGQNTFQFFDSVHPTTAVHLFAANHFADTVTAPRTIAPQGEVAVEAAFAFQNFLALTASTAAAQQDVGVSLFTDVRVRDTTRDGEATSYGYDTNSYALSVGASARGENLIVGVAGSFESSEVDLSTGKGTFDHEAMRLGGFVSFVEGPLSLTAAASLSDESFKDIERFTGVAGQVAVGNGDGRTIGGLVEGRYAVEAGGFTFTPLARFSVLNTELDSYTERGAVGLDQIVYARDLDPLRAEAGVEVSGNTGFAWRLEAVAVDALDEDDQVITTALRTIADVERTLVTEGTYGSTFGRLGGSASFDLSGFTLQVGAEGTTGRDTGDQWGAFGRIGKAF